LFIQKPLQYWNAEGKSLSRPCFSCTYHILSIPKQRSILSSGHDGRRDKIGRQKHGYHILSPCSLYPMWTTVQKQQARSGRELRMDTLKLAVDPHLSPVP
jgi:hypothetical protein